MRWVWYGGIKYFDSWEPKESLENQAKVSIIISNSFASFDPSTTGSQPSVPALRRRRRESQGRKGEKERSSFLTLFQECDVRLVC